MELVTIIHFSEKLLSAVGNTLLYSLWQGLILAGLTGLIIVSTRNSKSRIRYNLLCGMLGAFFIVSLFTFLYNFTSDSSNQTIPTYTVISSDKSGLLASLSNTPIFTATKQYIADYNGTIVLIWCLIVVARCFQLVIGLNELQHLRKNANYGSVGKWQIDVQNLASQLGINQTVRIAESAITRVPVVIGHLKPLILMPIGLLTALSTKEIEAIIVHELAHVYRRDYLINLLQSGMEILFFFNPAVLWLSDLIKIERENCCDDIAIGKTNSKVNYIAALIACHEYQKNTTSYAMSFSKRGGLRDRVKRLVGGGNGSLSIVERAILGISIAVLGFGIIIFSNSSEAKYPLYNATLEKNILNEKKIETAAQKSLFVDTSLIINTQNQVCDTVTVTRKRTETTTTTDFKTEAAEANSNVVKVEVDTPITINLAIEVPVNDKERSYVIAKPIPPVRPVIPSKPATQVSIGHKVAEELVNDSLVSKIDQRLSFKLSDTELVVNGKKISQEIYRKYRSKYVPVVGRDGWTLYYNSNTSTRVGAG
ncbi:MAG: M56 family metallopeptidase [Pedobacter sp.]|nr:MAG: M56 family metallopeptidase [Pedobacter sp.]